MNNFQTIVKNNRKKPNNQKRYLFSTPTNAMCFDKKKNFLILSKKIRKNSRISEKAILELLTTK